MPTHYTYAKTEDGEDEVSFHGIPYADFDKTGHWSIYSISRFFEVSRRTFFKDMAIDSQTTKVVSRLKIILNDGFQNSVTLAKEFIPLFRVSLVELGNTSFTLRSRLFDKIIGQQLGQNVSVVVRIGMESRKPEALSPYYKEKYSSLYQSPSKIWSRDAWKRPQSVFSTTTTVRYSDHDEQGHVNNCSYILFCMNCGSTAATSGFYRHYDSELFCYGVLELDIRYVQESRANSVLQISTWQDEINVQKIYFEVTRDNELITTATFIFGLEKYDDML